VTPKVIRTSLDWFQQSFVGELYTDAETALPSLKAKAQSRNAPEPHMLGLVELMVMPKAFGMWAYVLKHPEFEILLAPNAPKGSPRASVRLSAFGLANTEPSVLWDFACACLLCLGDYHPLALTRVDVAADFQYWEPTSEDLASMVCAASYRGTHGIEEGVQTFQYGKGAVVMRLYNKTVEIVHSKKDWMHEVWALTGRYDAAHSVWRVEAQLRGACLSELGIRTPAQVFADPGALLDYGLSWAQLRVPTADSTKTRWPEDPHWTALRAHIYGGIPLSRKGRVSELMSLDRTRSSYIGAVATAAAYFETNDFMDASRRLSLSAEAHMMIEGVDFAELVETKRRRIMGRL